MFYTLIFLSVITGQRSLLTVHVFVLIKVVKFAQMQISKLYFELNIYHVKLLINGRLNNRKLCQEHQIFRDFSKFTKLIKTVLLSKKYFGKTY